jgi:TonB family protein
MNKRRIKQIERTKCLFFFSLMALLFIAGNIEAVARSTEKTISRTTEAAPIVAGDLRPQLTDVLLKGENAEMPADTTVYEVVEQMPEFPGGIKALSDYLKGSIRYPKNAEKKKVEGRVIVLFVVDKEGNIVNPRILRNVDPDLDQEALRVIKAMPKWIPGIQRGKKVMVRYSIPISFSLSSKQTAK